MRSEVDPADRRGRLLSLTDAGQALLQSAVPIWIETHQQVERLLTDADADGFRADLRSMS